MTSQWDAGDNGRLPGGRQTVALTTLAWAAGLGVIVAGLEDEPERFSLEVWLAAGGTFLLLSLTAGLLRSAGSASDPDLDDGEDRTWFVVRQLQRLWTRLDTTLAASALGRRWGRSAQREGVAPPAAFQALADLLDLSYESERMFARRLQPRLQALADHFLPLRHGVDPADPAAVRQVLGSTAWLIEDQPSADGSKRRPEPDDVDRFLSALLADPAPEPGHNVSTPEPSTLEVSTLEGTAAT